jgi:hypothetical protein
MTRLGISTKYQTEGVGWRRLTGETIIVQVAVVRAVSELATILKVVTPVTEFDPFARDSVVVGHLFVEVVAVLDGELVLCGITAD